MASNKKQQAEDDLMDNSIVHGFQNLRVLTPYDFHQMDELVQDLTHALEESTRTKRSKHGDGNHGQQQRKVKRKSKKRKCSNTNASNIATGNMSEASISSIDEAIKDYMENIIQLSDSDDLILNSSKAAALSTLVKFSSNSISIAESDSFTENGPMRQGRRRRRLKRMTIDAQPDNPEISIVDYLNEQRLKRLKSSLKPKLKIQEQKGDGREMDSETSLFSLSDSQQATPTKFAGDCESVLSLCGKRKRGVRNMGSFEGVIDEEAGSEASGKGKGAEGVLESSSSIGSNSSCESDIYTDGGQEGDDEQSDFYHESGPSCGIPGIIPWWESPSFLKGDEENLVTDARFNMILGENFQHMSRSSQRCLMSRLKYMSHSGRKIRIGRRRLKDRKPAFASPRYMDERRDCYQGSSFRTNFRQVRGRYEGSMAGTAVSFNDAKAGGMLVDEGSNGVGSNGGGQHYETKRRRKTQAGNTELAMGEEELGTDQLNAVENQFKPTAQSPKTGLHSKSARATNNPVFKRPTRIGPGVIGRKPIPANRHTGAVHHHHSMEPGTENIDNNLEVELPIGIENHISSHPSQIPATQFTGLINNGANAPFSGLIPSADMANHPLIGNNIAGADILIHPLIGNNSGGANMLNHPLITADNLTCSGLDEDVIDDTEIAKCTEIGTSMSINSTGSITGVVGLVYNRCNSAPGNIECSTANCIEENSS